MTPNNPPSPAEAPLRPHSFDGIQEYDKRLPNWWLLTFYGAIVFGIVCWLRTQHFAGPDDAAQLRAELARIEAAKFASVSALDDATLWKMSRNPVVVASGRATFNTTCVGCHLASLRGKDENPQAIGVNLTDQIWIHGGRPMEINSTINTGVPAKGMPTWGPILGPKKITELVAYVLSYHQEGEPVIAAPSTAPAVPAPVAGTPK